jgi:hypothetical protein
MFDERKSPSTAYHDECWYLDCSGGSNYGPELDIVAPGVMIATSDISGSAGYSSGDYYSFFNGTSSACPNAAAVVALILSVNPNLTQSQARAYLEKNADKVLPFTYFYQTNAAYPNGTWNNQVGYGRVNALKAVEDVFFSNVLLNGSNNACSTAQQTFTLSQVPTGFTPTWTHSPNLTKISETATTITVSPNGGSSGNAWVKATFGTKEIVKNVWVGVPYITNTAERPSHCQFQFRAKDYYPTENSDTTFSWSYVSGTGNASPSNFSTSGDFASIYACPPFTFRLKITANNSCGTIEQFVDLWLNNDDEEINRSNNNHLFSISPNPSSDYVNISLAGGNKTLPQTNKIQAELYNNMGNKVRSISLNNNKGTISLSGLLQGIYTLKIIYDGQVESHQIIKK